MADQIAAAQKEEKPWEKSWSYADMKNNSTNWTLAGDAGLLLHLKQFSENLISKSVEIEKKLQKLNHTERQCLAKLNNVTSSFLLLENSQFIENRVYEHELADAKVKEADVKKEKTKEEKELELFNRMNEAVQVGMSIMDSYFEKLDPKQAKSKENDDEDDEEEDEKNTADTGEMFIYETKDPYVLRSLPYLIGSQAFLDNDHVGLKDLDSEDEEVEEEEEEDEEINEQEEDEEESEHEEKSQLGQQKKASDSESSESSDDDLFQGDKKGNLFDDSDTSSDEDAKVKVKPKRALTNQEEEDLFESEKSKEEEPAQKPSAQPPVLDFAAELSARFANKNKPSGENLMEDNKKKETEPAPAKLPVKQPAKSNLFDSVDSEEDDNQLFKSTKKADKGLFDDDEQEDNFMSVKEKQKPIVQLPPPPPPEPEPEPEAPKSKTMPKSDLTSALNDLFAKKAKPSFLSSDDDEALFSSNKPEPTAPKASAPATTTTQQATKKKMSIFDDEDDDDEVVKKPEPPRPAPAASSTTKPAKSIFDDDDDEDEGGLFSSKLPSRPATSATSAQQQQQQPAKKPVSLFDSTDSSPESNLDEPKTKPNTTSTATKPANKPSNLFETSEESSSPDLFTSTKLANKQAAETSELFPDEANDSMPELKAKPAPAVKTELPAKSETKTVKKSLFDSSTEDESDDLFKVTKPPVEPVKQQEVKKPIQPTKSLFDSKSEEDDDDLFKTKSAKKIEPVLKDPLFKDSQTAEPAPPMVRKPTNEDLPEKIDEKPAPTKPISGKNILFNPAALKNSNLFKKLAVQSKDSDESDDNQTETKPVEPAKIAAETPISPAVLAENVDDFFTSAKSTTQVSKSNNEPPLVEEYSSQGDDLFSEIKVDKAFSDLTMKNAQKDRIKAAAGKKRPPSNRKPTVEKEPTDLDEPFRTSEPIKPVEAIKKEQPKKPAVSIFDDDEDLFAPKVTSQTNKAESTKPIIEPPSLSPSPPPLLVQETKPNLNFDQKSNMSRKSLNNIFDDNDDDDIFKAKPVAKSNIQAEIKTEPDKKPATTSTTTANVPPVTATTTTAASASLLDSNSDDFDLFTSASASSTKNKKKNEPTKKTLDNIFDDDTDIFSDVASLANKKKPTESSTKKKTETTTATVVKPVAKTNKKDLFADLSDDDDIFSSTKPRSASGSKPSTTSKKEDANKKKDDIFDDPLNWS